MLPPVSVGCFCCGSVVRVTGVPGLAELALEIGDVEAIGRITGWPRTAVGAEQTGHNAHGRTRQSCSGWIGVDSSDAILVIGLKADAATEIEEAPRYPNHVSGRVALRLALIEDLSGSQVFEAQSD